MNETEALVAISSFVPFGPARIKLLLSYFGGARETWKAETSALRQIGLGEERVAGFINYRRTFNPSKYFNRLNKLKINTVTFKDKNYPVNLGQLEDSPVVLYIKGKLKPVDEVSVAIVGSRKMTSYGKEVAVKFAAGLATFGVTIVSGLARGIDTQAHQAALSSGGRTIAVIGCGLDSLYPPENFRLAKEITRAGALVSEYPLGYPAKPINFAARNRIISGLSRAVIVVEGAQKSGTLLTASHAAQQGRTVFAIPGQITSPLSAAPLFLIKNGAKMATDVRDIVEELNLQVAVNREEIAKVLPSGKGEALILAILENESLHLDELARISSLEVSEVSARLTMMELKGMVKNMGGGVYKKN